MSHPLRQSERAVAQLQALIAQHRWPPHMRLPSERRLATLAGTSHAAMNRAVLALIAQGVLRREGYRLFLAGSAPRSGPVVVIGPDSILRGVSRWAPPSLRVVIPEGDWGNPSWQREQLAKCLDQPPLGLLIRLVHPDQTAPALHELQARGCAVVLCDSWLPGCDTVGIDVDDGVRQALHHFAQLGHRSCHLIVDRQEGSSARLIEAFELWSHVHNFRESAATAITTLEHSRDVPTLAPFTQATALLCGNDLIARALCDQGAAQHWAICGFTDVIEARDRRPRITSVGCGAAEHFGWLAAGLLFERLDALGLPAPPRHVAIKPTLHIRDTSRPGPEPHPTPRPVRWRPVDLSPTSQRWPLDAGERVRLVRQMRRVPYPSIAGLNADHFHPHDLRAFTNRSRTAARGWFGEPLLHFTAGLQTIHGIPFHVIDERHPDATSAIALRSDRIKTSGGRPLPTRVRCPIQLQARGVYVLHGCGFAGANAAPCGEYRVETGNHPDLIQPIVPLGRSKDSEGATIQDWWFEYEQFAHETARRLVVAPHDDPMIYERYLYTLRWMFDRTVPVEAIVFRSCPGAASLAILAVTWLLDVPE